MTIAGDDAAGTRRRLPYSYGNHISIQCGYAAILPAVGQSRPTGGGASFVTWPMLGGVYIDDFCRLFRTDRRSSRSVGLKWPLLCGISSASAGAYHTPLPMPDDDYLPDAICHAASGEN